MSAMDSNSPGENTSIIVNSMRKQRRSMRLPLIVGTVALLGLVGIMMLGVGSQRQGNYKVDGTKAAAPLHETLSADGHSSDAAADVGQVEVRINSGGQLWIDGKNHGSATKHSLKLEKGPHTLVVKHRGAAVVSQVITVVAQKSVLVDFHKNKAQVLDQDAKDPAR